MINQVNISSVLGLSCPVLHVNGAKQVTIINSLFYENKAYSEKFSSSKTDGRGGVACISFVDELRI